ncbi:MAG: hypothetical protein ACRD3D_10970 [Terriglobia bacterium]
MSYTTLPSLAGMFPGFQRGTPQQRPADSLIQQYIDDVAADIDSVLQSRFGEAIQQNCAGSFTTFQSTFSTDALNVLEKINRYGAAAQLGQTLATMGVAAADRLANDFQSAFANLLADLNGTESKGGPAGTGLYDHLFDSQSRTPSPRPGFDGVAGGDQPRNQTPEDLGMSNFFGKFDRR